MRRIVMATTFAMVATAALAQARQSTMGMTCGEAAGLVAREGAIVLGTGPVTYDRFVAGTNQCQLGEFLEPAWAPTQDSAQCPIGYQCRSGPPPQNEQ